MISSIWANNIEQELSELKKKYTNDIRCEKAYSESLTESLRRMNDDYVQKKQHCQELLEVLEDFDEYLSHPDADIEYLRQRIKNVLEQFYHK